jgi:hypothetical protein
LGIRSDTGEQPIDSAGAEETISPGQWLLNGFALPFFGHKAVAESLFAVVRALQPELGRRELDLGRPGTSPLPESR